MFGADCETILEIKQELDRSYQQVCALPGDQQQIKSAIKKLLAQIMQAIRTAAANDAYAKQQLDDELEQQLVRAIQDFNEKHGYAKEEAAVAV